MPLHQESGLGFSYSRRLTDDFSWYFNGTVHLSDAASKGMSGRVIPMHPEVRAALIAYRQILTGPLGVYIIGTERRPSISPQVMPHRR